MIYTFTGNPSLDYYVSLTDPLEEGGFFRAQECHYAAGGKGVNVSIILNHFGIANTALGFLGGFTRDYYLSFLNAYPLIQPLFTKIKGNTRINLKLKSAVYTDINMSGPAVSQEEFAKLISLMQNIYERDCFVVGGNMHESLKEKMPSLLSEMIQSGAYVFLDTDIDTVKNVLPYHPYLIKVDEDELDELCPKGSLHKRLASLAEMGAQNVLFLSKKEILLYGEQSYVAKVKEENYHDTVGKSDALLAGYIFALQRGANAKEAFSYAIAAVTMGEDPLLSENGRELLEKAVESVEIQLWEKD